MIRLLAPFVAAGVIAVFFALSRIIEAKVAQSDGGMWTYVRMSLLWAVLILPIMPMFLWALRTAYTTAGQRLWAMPIAMFAMSSLASAIVFWVIQDELPSRGTLVGLGLSTAAMLCCLWR